MSYIEDHLNGGVLKGYTKKAKKVIKRFNLDFDTIAVRGVSGMLFGPVLAAKLNKNLIVVRKEKACHSEEMVEGWGIHQKILIVDDFISTGQTIEDIKQAVMDRCDSPTIVGVLLYDSLLCDTLVEYYSEHACEDGTVMPIYHARERGEK